MAATIKDIARELKVSVSTVSYALNGGPKPVSDEVRSEVQRVARELGYRPNQVARSLVTRKTQVIGVVLPMMEQDVLKRPFIQNSLNMVINVAEQVSYDLMLLTGGERSNPQELKSLLRDPRVDGLILVAPPENQELVDVLRQSSVPYAIVAGGDDRPGPFYRIDDEAGVRMAMEHLWHLGHRRIAHLQGRPNLRDARVRRGAFEAFLGERGVQVREGYVRSAMYRRDMAEEALAPFLALPEPPTAIFCGNDEMAIGLMIAARKLRISLPGDLSIVGFDDTDPASSLDPPLTTVCQPIEEMAACAFRDVLDQLAGKPQGTGTTFAPSLSVRCSTQYPKREHPNA